MNRQAWFAVIAALALALPAPAQDPPALELTPLVPPPAPWLRKNQKKNQKKIRKKVQPAPSETQPSAPFVAAPPPAVPPLAQPEPAKPAEQAPAVAAPPSMPLQEELPLAPLAPPPLAPLIQPVPQAAVAAEPAAPAARRNWTRPVGYAALGAGGVALGLGAVLGAIGRSDINKAESAFNGGAFRPGDADRLASGNSKARSANALFIASGVLLAAGAIFTFAF